MIYSRVSESEHEAQESIISVLVLFDFFVGRGQDAYELFVAEIERPIGVYEINVAKIKAYTSSVSFFRRGEHERHLREQFLNSPNCYRVKMIAMPMGDKDKIQPREIGDIQWPLHHPAVRRLSARIFLLQEIRKVRIDKKDLFMPAKCEACLANPPESKSALEGANIINKRARKRLG